MLAPREEQEVGERMAAADSGTHVYAQDARNANILISIRAHPTSPTDTIGKVCCPLTHSMRTAVIEYTST